MNKAFYTFLPGNLLLSTLIIGLVFSINLSAQNHDVVQVSGTVKSDSSQILPFTTILNLTHQQGTISNIDGFFSFPARNGDSLKFSFIGFKSIYKIIPDSLDADHIDFEIILEADTFILKEAVVFPWQTYDQFLRAVAEYEMPNTDYERAMNNLALLEKHGLDMRNSVVDAGLNYKYFMNQHYDQIYHAGQVRSISLLNPFAWAQFIEALKNGDFKKKDDD